MSAVAALALAQKLLLGDTARHHGYDPPPVQCCLIRAIDRSCPMRPLSPTGLP
jgi:hypothetical protein